MVYTTKPKPTPKISNSFTSASTEELDVSVLNEYMLDYIHHVKLQKISSGVVVRGEGGVSLP